MGAFQRTYIDKVERTVWQRGELYGMESVLYISYSENSAIVGNSKGRFESPHSVRRKSDLEPRHCPVPPNEWVLLIRGIVGQSDHDIRVVQTERSAAGSTQCPQIRDLPISPKSGMIKPNDVTEERES